jgi:hypothetical protein
MRAPASIFKHSIHPTLIVFPIGIWMGVSVDAWCASRGPRRATTAFT